jgi:hypothetical protein
MSSLMLDRLKYMQQEVEQYILRPINLNPFGMQKNCVNSGGSMLLRHSFAISRFAHMKFYWAFFCQS